MEDKVRMTKRRNERRLASETTGPGAMVFESRIAMGDIEKQ